MVEVLEEGEWGWGGGQLARRDFPRPGLPAALRLRVPRGAAAAAVPGRPAGGLRTRVTKDIACCARTEPLCMAMGQSMGNIKLHIYIYMFQLHLWLWVNVKPGIRPEI